MDQREVHARSGPPQLTGGEKVLGKQWDLTADSLATRFACCCRGSRRKVIGEVVSVNFSSLTHAANGGNRARTGREDEEGRVRLDLTKKN
jgi:hypothetical protein